MRIFNIERFSIHDGPGIRTVIFMKGCTLRCIWCHNPEGQNPFPELMVYSYRCNECMNCIEKCPVNALTIKNTKINIDRKKCNLCGNCIKYCPRNVFEIAGKDISEKEIFEIINKDKEYYDASDGGVTFSGGEPLMQYESLIKLMNILIEKKISTVLETSAYINSEIFKKTINHFDFIYGDIKHVDPLEHYKVTQGDLRLILLNLKYLDSLKKDYVIRIPIIPNYGIYKSEQIPDLLKILNEFKNLKKVELLRYHSLGNSKYIALSRVPLRNMENISIDFLNLLKEKIENIGIEVRII